MMDLKQEARTLTLGERMVLAARFAVLEHLRQSVSTVPADSDPDSLPVRSDAANRAAELFVGAP